MCEKEDTTENAMITFQCFGNVVEDAQRMLAELTQRSGWGTDYGNRTVKI